MIKKISITVVILAVLSGAAWLIWNDLKDQSSPLAPVGENTIQGVTYETSTTTANSVDSAKDLEYRKQAIEIASSPIVFGAGVSETVKQKARTAIEDLNAKIKADYKILALWIDLGMQKQSIGDYNGAKVALEFANKVWPKNYMSFQNLGFLYGFYIKNNVECEKNYLKSLENDASNVQPYLDLADIYYYQYKEKSAQIPAFLLGGINQVNDSDKLILKSKLAWYYMELKDYANAIKYYEQILEKDPENQALIDEINRIKTL